VFRTQAARGGVWQLVCGPGRALRAWLTRRRAAREAALDAADAKLIRERRATSSGEFLTLDEAKERLGL